MHLTSLPPVIFRWRTMAIGHRWRRESGSAPRLAAFVLHWLGQFPTIWWLMHPICWNGITGRLNSHRAIMPFCLCRNKPQLHDFLPLNPTHLQAYLKRRKYKGNDELVIKILLSNEEVAHVSRRPVVGRHKSSEPMLILSLLLHWDIDWRHQYSHASNLESALPWFWVMIIRQKLSLDTSFYSQQLYHFYCIRKKAWKGLLPTKKVSLPCKTFTCTYLHFWSIAIWAKVVGKASSA